MNAEPQLSIWMVRADELSTWQPVMETMLERLMPRFAGRLEMPDVFESIEVGKLTAWLVFAGQLAAVALVEIVNYPRGKWCRIVGLAGDGLRVWSDPLHDAIEEWARSEGCTYMEITGRNGWDRYMADRYTMAQVVLERKL